MYKFKSKGEKKSSVLVQRQSNRWNHLLLKGVSAFLFQSVRQLLG